MQAKNPKSSKIHERNLKNLSINLRVKVKIVKLQYLETRATSKQIINCQQGHFDPGCFVKFGLSICISSYEASLNLIYSVNSVYLIVYSQRKIMFTQNSK